MSSQDRLDELETQFAHQEDVIATLNNALVAQQTRIDQLEKKLSLSIETVRRLSEQLNLSAPDDEPPPPHY